jgi:hypothetical protein
MGNERQLVVMPPYNLYLLLHRNFCAMGGLIERAVFEEGFRFRPGQSHEDWDFFVQLGLQGIYGHPLHEAPLRYRRWGYSRSDGVNERPGSAPTMQPLGPDANESGRLIGIKSEWAPALSVVVPHPGTHVVAGQTCDDFEVVAHEAGRPPRVRGRWVLMLDEGGT